MGVKRYIAWAILGTSVALVGTVAFTLWLLDEQRAVLSAPIEAFLVSPFWLRVGGVVGGLVVLGGLLLAAVSVGRLNRSLISNWVDDPGEAGALLHSRLRLARGPKLVAIGGGTGLSLLLRGLREHTANLTAVVAVSDDGGSSGRLRAALGMPAPGDLSDCLAALSVDEASMGRLMEFRFARGAELQGHTFGNLLLATLSEMEENFGDALRTVQRLLDLRGAVWPATAEPVTLSVTKRDGKVLRGESQLAQHPGAVERVALEPANADALPEVLAAIANADLVVLGPGSLFTSIMPPVLVPAVAAALRTTSAPVVQVLNIMTEAGETDGFDAWEHVRAVEAHVGRLPDIVLVNATPIDAARLASYREENASVVAWDPARFRQAGVRVVQKPLLGGGRHAQHDTVSLSEALLALALEARRA
jgi:uncharacterized cofD-like protein